MILTCSERKIVHKRYYILISDSSAIRLYQEKRDLRALPWSFTVVKKARKLPVSEKSHHESDTFYFVHTPQQFIRFAVLVFAVISIVDQPF